MHKTNKTNIEAVQ